MKLWGGLFPTSFHIENAHIKGKKAKKSKTKQNKQKPPQSKINKKITWGQGDKQRGSFSWYAVGGVNWAINGQQLDWQPIFHALTQQPPPKNPQLFHVYEFNL